MIARALTLVEVLAAVVLLSILSAASAQMLGAVRDHIDHAPGIVLSELTIFADTFMEEPAKFGVNALPENISDEELTVPWPDEPARAPVTLARIEPDNPATEHAWLAFRCGTLVVVRYIPVLPKEPERR